MPLQSRSFRAAGNISPCRVVVWDSTVYQVVQATNSTALPVGIAQEGTRLPPGTTGADGYAARSGEDLRVYQDGEECLAECGGTVTFGTLIKANTDGTVVTFTPGTTSVAYSIGQALESGTTGQKIKVRVRIQTALV